MTASTCHVEDVEGLVVSGHQDEEGVPVSGEHQGGGDDAHQQEHGSQHHSVGLINPTTNCN